MLYSNPADRPHVPHGIFFFLHDRFLDFFPPEFYPTPICLLLHVQVQHVGPTRYVVRSQMCMDDPFT
jgi:hypothetical protein